MERVGENLLVMAPGGADVMKLTVEQDQVLNRIIAGEPVGSSAVTEQLVELGLVTATSGITRRGVLSAGAVGAGLAVLSLPTAALASSDPIDNSGSSDGDDNSGSSDGDGSCEANWEIHPRKDAAYIDSPLEVQLQIAGPELTEGSVSAMTLVSYDNSDFDSPHKVSSEWVTIGYDFVVEENYISWEFGKGLPDGNAANGWVGVARIDEVCYRIVLG
jgi:hypothetical protein